MMIESVKSILYNKSGSQIPGWLSIVGLLLACVYSFSAFIFKDIYSDYVESLFYFVVMLAFLWFGGRLRFSLYTWIAVVMVLISVISWILISIDHPEQARSRPSPGDLVDKLLFVPLALILGASRVRILLFWTCAMAALILMPWVLGGGYKEIMKGVDGVRVGLGTNPMRTGLMYGTMLVGLLVMLPFYVYKIKRVWMALPLLIFFAPLIAYSGFGVFASQTRAVFLALMVSFFVVVAIFCIYLLAKKPSTQDLNWSRLKVLLVFTSFSLFSLLYFFHVPLVSMYERFDNELKVLSESELKPDVIPETNFGLRVIYWNIGIESIKERPIAGWDRDGGRLLLEDDGYNNNTIHNLFLEAGVRYGIFAILMILMLFIFSYWLIVRAWRSGVMPPEIFIFSIVFIVFFLVSNMFSSNFFQDAGVYIFNIVMAGVMAYPIANYCSSK
ncbi:MAG: O-antigen ligase family protein [Marinospirillum sp.]|uniref:O-antigen ligase family protein n=1 Tax=Marinospirillum sp. TaxID=2183934 RepID=UPI0019E698DE|nr:O-antigen ligase family protein [Marinospirillum sp.]MBE0508221.1 O-antigen ligase family protein [Marinospirillum sp.]